MSLESDLSEGLCAMGITLDGSQQSRLLDYLRLVEKWNRVHNLTAVRDIAQMVPLHLLDSLTLLGSLGSAGSLLDVGSGAGFPGVPVALARPALPVTLLDASHKRATFLRQAKAELALTHVEIACERVEHWQPGRTFDVIVSRAFAELADFVTQSRHLLAPGGTMIAMKGVHPDEELARLPATHRIEAIVQVHVPTLDAQRHLILLKAA